MKKKICATCLLLIMVLLFSGCNLIPDATQEPKTQSKAFYEYFDTECAVFSYAGDTESFEENVAYVKGELERYHRLFDIYHGYAGVTNIYTLNKTAKQEPVEVSEELFEFLLYAKEMYTLTNGKVNVAMGRVLAIWHDTREWVEEDPMNAVMPTEAELREAGEHTDINDLVLDEENRTVYYADERLRLDVGALAKGYACEKIAQGLIARGVSSYVLNFGGNIRTIGERPSGDGWTTGIRNPQKGDNPFVLRVMLKKISLVTSGDYQRYFVYDGVKYHHIIDPETLYPTKHFTSVSILTESSALADALSTAFFCMSYEDGLQMISNLSAHGITVDAMWVTLDGEVLMTDGFAAIVIEE